MKKDSGIVLAPHDIAPNDMPGKMKKLFTCPGSRTWPSTTTSGKRVPLPKIALPSEKAYASAAVISACVFGFESAKMIGRPPAAPFALCTLSIACTTSRVKQPGDLPTAPMRTSGLNHSMILTSSVPHLRGLGRRKRCAGVARAGIAHGFRGGIARAAYGGFELSATALCSSFLYVPALSPLFQMRPRELVHATASAGTFASLMRSEAPPRLAEPAPWKRKRRRRASPTRSVASGFWILIPPRTAATATEAVPWMSSLYVR